VNPEEQERARREFEWAVAFGPTRTAVAFAVAEASQRDEAVTVAEAQQHTDVTTTTVRNALQRLVHDGLAEATKKDGRLAFRLTPFGRVGYEAWQAKQQGRSRQLADRPPRTANLHRWRVKGFAARSEPLDPASAFADVDRTRVELLDFAPRASLTVEVEYEVDAIDEQEARAALSDAGWMVDPMLGKAERIGLARELPVRSGHWLELRERDSDAIVAAVRASLAGHKKLIRSIEEVEGLGERHDLAAETVLGFLRFVQVPESRRLPIPDDEQLVHAIKTLWAPLDHAGVRAVGKAFLVSERELREMFARTAARSGEPSETDDELLERMLDDYRKQGRLGP
jgi:hypothetical protein